MAEEIVSAGIVGVPTDKTVHISVASIDEHGQISEFSEEVTVTANHDETPPVAVTGLIAIPTLRGIELFWTAPEDRRYIYSEVYRSTTNDRTTAELSGDGYKSAVVVGLEPQTTYYFWVLPIDRSDNPTPRDVSDNDLNWEPADPNGGKEATTPLIQEGDIAERAVSSGKLLPDMRNLAENGALAEGDHSWSFSAGQFTIVEDAVNAFFGNFVIRKVTGVTSALAENDAFFQVVPGQQIWATAVGKSTGNGILKAGVAWYDGDKEFISTTLTPGTNLIPAYLRNENRVTAPSGARYGRMVAEVSSHSSGTVFVDDIWGLTVIIANLIGANAIAANHLRTDTAVITVSAQIANAIIGNAKITDLNATKINAGTLAADRIQAATLVGVNAKLANAEITSAKIASISAGQITTGQVSSETIIVSSSAGNDSIHISGPTNSIVVFDANTAVRVRIGDLGGGGTNYGHQVFDASGNLMWGVNGAETLGLVHNSATDFYAGSDTNNGTIPGSETSRVAVTIGGTFQQGIVVLRAFMRVDIPDGEWVRFRFRRTSVLGVIVGDVMYTNASGAAYSASLTPTAFDTTPSWSGVYVCTIQGGLIGGGTPTGAYHFSHLHVEHIKR